jgi:Protein of unknown function (DUF3313)
MLRYANPNANWSSYTKIMIAPVTYWAADDSKVSAADQQALCDYMYIVLGEDLGKDFVIVDQPGPGVIKISAALTDATSAVPVFALGVRSSAAGSCIECYQDGCHGNLRIRGFCSGCPQGERFRVGTVTGGRG